MNSDGMQIRLGDLVYQVKKRWVMVLALTLAGLVVGALLAGASYLQGAMAKTYEVTSSVLLSAKSKQGRYSGEKTTPDLNDFRLSQEMTETARFVMGSEVVLKKVIEKNGLIGITAKDVSSNLKLTANEDSPVIVMSLAWRSSEEGENLLSGIVDAANETLQEKAGVGSLSTVDEPVAKYVVGGNLNAPIWGVMALLGFAIGMGLVAAELLLRPTFINVKDVPDETGLDVIGIVPKDDAFFAKERSPLDRPETDVAGVWRDYSAISYVLRNRLGKKDHVVVCVTSTVRGEGRTTVAAHVATSLAEMEKKVLLIDFDARNPVLSSMFLKNVDYERSLNALYRGEIPETHAISSLTGKLDLMPVVLEHSPMPIDGAITELIERLSKNYDFVIIDAAPIEESADALSLSRVADVSLMVIGFDVASKRQVIDATGKMDKAGIDVVGCVVNMEKSIEAEGLFAKDKSSGSDKRKKKRKIRPAGKKRRVKKGESNPKEDTVATDPESESKPAAPVPENDDAKQDEPERIPDPVSDEDALEALLKIGVENEKK